MATALYARKSIERENSISCETQLEYCLSMLKPLERKGEILTFTDNGCSGGNLNRKGFLEMMDKIKSGQISKVVVYRLDRISRSLADFVKILSDFRRYGVEFVSSQESFDTSSPYGDLIVKILAVFAEFERSSIISRVTQAYDSRSDKGFFMGGKIPFGYSLSKTQIAGKITGMFVADEEKSCIVLSAYNEYIKPKNSLSTTVKYLNFAYGTDFTSSALCTMLKNPVYVRADSRIFEYYSMQNVRIVSQPDSFDGIHGVMKYGASGKNKEIKLVSMPHIGIVDSALWLGVQKKISRNSVKGRSTANFTSYLSGILVCGNCGSKLTTVKAVVNKYGEMRRYFACPNKNCEGILATLYAESLENAVSAELSALFSNLPMPNSKGSKYVSEINEAQNSINSIEVQQRKLCDLVLSKALNSDMTEIANLKAMELSRQKKRLEQQISELREKESVFVNFDFVLAWENADTVLKKEILSEIVSKIIVDNDGNLEIRFCT